MHHGTRCQLVLAACSLSSAATSRPTTTVLGKSFDEKRGPGLALIIMRRDIDRDWLSASAAAHRPGRAGVAAAWRYGYVNHRLFRRGSRIIKKERAARLHCWYCAAVCVCAYPMTRGRRGRD
jgi:hypothetical protein